MLGTLRKHSKSVIVYVLFGIIIVVFVFTFNVATPDLGCGGTGNRGLKGSLVTIDQIELGTSAMNMGMSLSAEAPPVRADRMDQNQLRKELIYRTTRFWVLGQPEKYKIFNQNPKTVSMIKLRKVMDDLEETYLVSNQAMKMGFYAPRKEIANEIVKRFSDPEKKTFNAKYYRRWVRYNLGTTIPKFEDFIGREILRRKMIDLVTAPVRLSQRDKDLIKKFAGITLKCSFARVSPEKLSTTSKVTDQDARAYLKKHEAQASQYFETHQSDFRKPDLYKIHIFQVKAPSRNYMKTVSDDVRKGLEKQWDAAKKAAQGYYSKLKSAGQDKLVQEFESLAKAKSDNEATRDNGGAIDKGLDLKSLAQFDPAVAAWASNAGKGSLSKPLKGDEGYYICYMDDVKRATPVQFKDVKIKVAKTLLATEAAQKNTKSVAQALLKLAMSMPDKTLTDVVKQFNDQQFNGRKVVSTGETGEFSPVKLDFASVVDNDPAAIPSIGVDQDLATAILKVKKPGTLVNGVYKPEGSRSFFVVRVTERKASKPDKDKLDTLFNTLQRFKKVAAYRAWYKALRTKAIKEGRLVEHETLLKLIQQQVKSREEEMKHTNNSLRLKLHNLK